MLATWFSWNGEFGDLRLFKPPALELDKPVAPRPTPMKRLIGLNRELDEDDSDFSLARCCGMYWVLAPEHHEDVDETGETALTRSGSSSLS